MNKIETATCFEITEKKILSVWETQDSIKLTVISSVTTHQSSQTLCSIVVNKRVCINISSSPCVE